MLMGFVTMSAIKFYQDWICSGEEVIKILTNQSFIGQLDYSYMNNEISRQDKTTNHYC